MRFLVGCHYLVASGGLLRFEKTCAGLRSMGHGSAFAAAVSDREFEPSFPVLGLDEAAASRWDAVIIPGADFPDETIQTFGRFKAPQFGVRVQMILNDQHMRPKFLKVNAAFEPHLVVFNNEHWPPGSYREFQAAQFHNLVGAVDTALFRPDEDMTKRQDGFVVGAQIAKNAEPLVQALALLPEDFRIRFFGFDRHGLMQRVRDPRIEYTGPLFGEDLARYFRSLDAVVSTEERAGWANVVAEAMASGTGVVTTPAGTLSMARHEETALVVDRATPAAIAQALSRLRHDPALTHRLRRAARRTIEAYDWNEYARRFAELVHSFDGAEHYLRAPELGLFGKTTLDERLDGLEPLLAGAGEFGAILDVGAAEGMTAHLFCQRGAGRVDAWEKNRRRVEAGERLFGRTPGFTIGAADLASEGDWARLEARAPAAGYDLVLYLGVHHHLPRDARSAALGRLLKLTRGRLALRTPAATFEKERLASRIEGMGFALERSVAPGAGSFAGPLHIYRRTP